MIENEHYPSYQLHYSFFCHSSQRLPVLPASGYRHVTTGVLTSVGDGGWCWSSSSYAAGNRNAGSLNFNTGNVNPLNNDNRANGFAVRCVQHLRGCLPRVKA